jgi:hypothetical protein
MDSENDMYWQGLIFKVHRKLCSHAQFSVHFQPVAASGFLNSRGFIYCQDKIPCTFSPPGASGEFNLAYRLLLCPDMT